MEPTIDDLRRIQAERELGDTHVVWIGECGFRLAHTDFERILADPMKHEVPRSLTLCALHVWLRDLDEAPVDVGLYMAYPHHPDAYSEDWGRLPFDFVPLIGSWPT